MREPARRPMVGKFFESDSIVAQLRAINSRARGEDFTAHLENEVNGADFSDEIFPSNPTSATWLTSTEEDVRLHL